MRLLSPLYPSLAALLMTGAAAAAAPQQLASTSTAKPAAAKTASTSPESSPPQNPLQALCREIFVKVDEGYGVTGQETRTICDEPR